MKGYETYAWRRMMGDDAEWAFARAFGTNRTCGGVGDCGHDVETGEPDIPFVQVRSGPTGMIEFIRGSMRRKFFKPICVGEPGARAEMLESIRQCGAWVGRDVPNRERLLQFATEARRECNACTLKPCLTGYSSTALRMAA